MSGHPFKVKAIFEYTSPHEDDLHFPEGQIITVTEDDEEDWFTGEYVDPSGVKQSGIFPRNFVEKFEPTAPPRPTRTARPKKEVEAPSAVPEPALQSPVVKDSSNEQPRTEARDRSVNTEVSQPAPQHSEQAPPPTSRRVEVLPAAAPAAPKSVSAKSPPPPVSEKPGGSFRDRIAAFNKSAAPPPAPFKPGGLSAGGASFIKKPFVAPPPSKDAYVPLPREPAPQRIYRRNEDPEIAAKEVENQEIAEKAGLAPTTAEGEEEDLPKPTSLKERIALLQKQQAEQAARHADAVQKKEKPKRPAKKRTDSHNVTEEQEGEEAALEKQDSHTTVGKKSMDSGQDDSSAPRPVTRRKSSKGPPAVPGLPRDSFGDGNEADMSGAGDETDPTEEASTGRDESDDKPKARPVSHAHQAPASSREPENVHDDEEGGNGEEGVEEDEEEEDDIDPEVRRKEELRARMAKMSGGMGMHGIFGAGMPMPGPGLPPPKKKPSGSSKEKQSSEHIHEDVSSPATHAPPVPGIPLPGMARMRSPEEANKQLEVEREDEHPRTSLTESRAADDMPDVEDIQPSPAGRNKTDRPQPPNRNSFAAPPVPTGRPAPPPVPTDSRPPPPPAPSDPMSPSAGSESDDEMSIHAPRLSLDTPTSDASRAAPPRPSGPPIPNRPVEGPNSPRLATSKRASYLANESSPTSPTTPGGSSKRNSRVPPIPSANSSATSSQNRAPPPPPPGTSLSRSSTGDTYVLPPSKHIEQDDSDEEVTEYEGDYDTDIAPTATHKDALKSTVTDSSLDDNTPLRSMVGSPTGAPPALPPPVPTHRAVPPPPTSQPPPNSRPSADMPRAAPPPPPPKEHNYDEDDEEYDPYRYTAGRQSRLAGEPATQSGENDDDDLYSITPPRSQPPPPRPQQDRAPPPPPREQAPPPMTTGPGRQSTDIQRSQTSARRSMDLNRMTNDTGFVANDVDLGQGSLWWTQPNGIPAVFQNRKDILYESEESTTTKRGGKSTTTKDLYVLFQDYSQTIITVRFDPSNPSDAQLEQRHEQPPSRLRQDQLEATYDRFGRNIAAAVASKKDTVVGDGTPQALITELLKPFPSALLPIGTRAYGAVVYSNLANASTTQNDEIRPGDIITLRNAKFQGKHGPMHAKYSMEVGGAGAGSGHVGVVAEWDGTKKKVRAWEQGRDGGKKKVGLESYKLDDLRSGEVKIWRVMDRGWVGWEGVN